MGRVKTPSYCERCGAEFFRWSGQVHARFCSRQCNLQTFNEANPKWAAQVSRQTAKQRGDTQRDRGEGKSYRKRDGRHEHRIVAEVMIGRPLRVYEIVHHKDGNRRNNDPSNLAVMTQSQHAQLHQEERRQRETS